MSLTAQIFGRDSLIFKGANLGTLGIAGYLDRKMNPDADPTVQRLGDISQQTAKEGDPRTIVWGRVRPIGGNIIHCQAPVKRWVVTSTSSGGKGGGKKKQEQRTEHVYRTYAIGVCEGPITAFSRIWRNNKLVYDGRGTEWGDRNNGVFLKSFRLYLGGWSQMPDPTLQSIWGVGNVPAYRGTAYMVSIDEDLTDQGGMVPQWLFEVERAEYIPSTSKLYGLLVEDAARQAPSQPLNSSVRTEVWRFDSGELLGGAPPQPQSVVVQSSSYPMAYAETIGTSPPQPQDVSVVTALVPVEMFEGIEASSATPNDVAVWRQVVRFTLAETLGAAAPTPQNVEVITD